MSYITVKKMTLRTFKCDEDHVILFGLNLNKLYL